VDRTIIVGDVHGCRDELECLLRLCGWIRGERLILAGDLVAKGPDSQGVVELARTWGAKGVLGNHDAHVLRARDLRAGRAPADGKKKIRPEHQQVADTLGPDDWRYLEELQLFLRLGPESDGAADTAVVHAGAVPGVALEDQARENLITMRSIDDAGRASKRIEGTPWAVAWQGPERLIFGHDAVRGLQQHAWATGLDTACVYGGRLTALVLPERRLVSVPAKRSYVPR
jgi:hypothetical protein